MIQYISAREAAEKWNISQRRVSALCAENRIPDAAMLGNMWLIPKDAKKPDDARKSKNSRFRSAIAHPFVKWAGGKSQLIQTLKLHLPDMSGIRKYIEPFVGGGAFLFSLLAEYSLDEIYINDNNCELMNAFRAIKISSDALIDELRYLQSRYFSTECSERQNLYYSIREKFNKTILLDETCVEKAAMFIFLNRTCFNGLYRVNRSGDFNVPFGKYRNPTICDEENIKNVAKALENVTIFATDYHDMKQFVDASTLVYFDPPYRPLNKTSSFTSYTENCFNDKDQIALADFYTEIDCAGARVMLSNSDPKNVDEDDNFFDILYEKFNIHRVDASRVINSKGNLRGKIKELLITNY